MRRYEPNPRFEAEVAKSPAMRRATLAAANQIATAARQIAPHKTGYYERRFVVVEEHGEIRVGNTDPFAHLVEWGSANNPPFAPLRRGTRAAGLVLKEQPKG